MSIDSSDLQLLEFWRAGDKSAGNALVERHFDALHRFFATKAQTHMEDLIQETFMACVQTRDAFRGEASFRAYLFGLARFQLLRHYRKVYRLHDLSFTTASVRDFATSPSGELAKREELQLLQSALRCVSIDQQIALELTYVEDMPASEVASVLGIPENTVYSRLRRAKAHLKDALEALSPRK